MLAVMGSGLGRKLTTLIAKVIVKFGQRFVLILIIGGIFSTVLNNIIKKINITRALVFLLVKTIHIFLVIILN